MTDPHDPPTPDRSATGHSGIASPVHESGPVRTTGPDRARPDRTGTLDRTGTPDRRQADHRAGPAARGPVARSTGSVDRPGPPDHRAGSDRTTDPATPPAGRGPVMGTFLIAGAAIFVLAFLFSFGNVWALADLLGVKGWIAPLIGPAVDLSVVGVMIAVQWLSLAGISTDQLKPAMRLLYVCGIATLVLNSAPSAIAGYVHHNPQEWGRAGVEAVAPFLLIAWAHVGPIIVRLFVEVRERYTVALAAAAQARANLVIETDQAHQAEQGRHQAEAAAAQAALIEAAAQAAEGERLTREAAAGRAAQIELANAEAARVRAETDRTAAAARVAEAQADANRTAADLVRAEAAKIEATAAATMVRSAGPDGGDPPDRSGPSRRTGPADRTGGPDASGPVERREPPDRTDAADSNVAPINGAIALRIQALTLIRDAFPGYGTWDGLRAAVGDLRNAHVSLNKVRDATGMGKGRITAALEHANDQIVPYAGASPRSPSTAPTDSTDDPENDRVAV